MDRAARRSRPRSDRKTRLHIFDFDSTLFRSPGPMPGLNKQERREFWRSPESLGGDLVPDNPNENWYIAHVIDSFRRARKDPNAAVVVMSGRGEEMRQRVQELLERNDLTPDEVILKREEEPTQDYKTREMRRLLQKHPDVKKVHFYEDREPHLRHFQEQAEKDGFQFIPHLVPDEGDATKTWDDFMHTFYEGGAKQVKNTNHETRDRYPTVRADHLMRTDPHFSSRVKRQFRQWMSLGKPTGRPSEKNAATHHVLRLDLDLSAAAATRRLATRYLLGKTAP